MLRALWGLNSILNFRYSHLRPVKEATVPDLGVNEITRETWDGIQGGISIQFPKSPIWKTYTTQRKMGKFQQ